MARKKTKTQGRPTAYRKAFARVAGSLCLLGATDVEIAAALDVAESTINLWKLTHRDFSESIRRGKLQADALVAEKLFQRAVGYEQKQVKIFQADGESFEHEYIEKIAPDVGAAIFWLKNRRRGHEPGASSPLNWQDRPEVVVNQSQSVGLPEDLLQRARELAKSGGGAASTAAAGAGG